MNKTMTDSDRFLAKVSPEPNTGCWLWSGTFMKSGYGTLRIGSQKNGTRKNVLAHRFSLLVHGIEPSDGKYQALHHCDVKACVNPDHLYWGDHADNARDASDRNLLRHDCGCGGERNGRAKLTYEAVSMIRSSSESLSTLAEKYGVTKSSISAVRSMKTWL